MELKKLLLKGFAPNYTIEELHGLRLNTSEMYDLPLIFPNIRKLFMIRGEKITEMTFFEDRITMETVEHANNFFHFEKMFE